MINQRQTLLAGAIFGLLGVALGAFGAHALKATLLANNSLDTYELAVRYQFYHAFALLIIGVLMDRMRSKALHFSAVCMIVGIFLFSGSLYALAFKTAKFVVFVTPLGGMFFVAGWSLLIVTLAKYK